MWTSAVYNVYNVLHVVIAVEQGVSNRRTASSFSLFSSEEGFGVCIVCKFFSALVSMRRLDRRNWGGADAVDAAAYSSHREGGIH